MSISQSIELSFQIFYKDKGHIIYRVIFLFYFSKLLIKLSTKDYMARSVTQFMLFQSNFCTVTTKNS